MGEHAWPLTFGFLMIALLFVLIAFLGPSEELAKWWVTALIVGIILLTVWDLEDFGSDLRDWKLQRKQGHGPDYCNYYGRQYLKKYEEFED
jgi:hypothetical protein